MPTTTRLQGLGFISSNPATEAFNEGVRAAQEAYAKDQAIEASMLTNTFNRVAAPTKLRTMTAESDRTVADAAVATGTVQPRVQQQFDAARTSGANAEVAVGTVQPRISQAQSQASLSGTQAYVAGQTAPYTIDSAASGARTARSGANVAEATEGNRIQDAQSATRLAYTNANVSEATAADKVAQAHAQTRRSQAEAMNIELAGFYKSLDLLNAGDIEGAKIVAERTGNPLPDAVIQNSQLRRAMTNIAARAKELYANRPREQQAFIDAQMKVIKEKTESGVPVDSVLSPFQMPQGAPEPPVDTTRDRYSLYTQSAQGPDGKTVQRPYAFSQNEGTMTPVEVPTEGTFSRPGTPGAGASGARMPAEIATAQWLVQNGVAPNEATAWQMVRQSRSNPKAIEASVYNTALRAGYGNAAKAQATLDQWRKLNAGAQPAAAPAPVAPAPARPEIEEAHV